MKDLFYRLAEKVRKNEPIPFPLAALLEAGTPVVRIGMWARTRRPRVRVPARVISFGNITAGGTGKTPAVIERARKEIAAGHKVAVLTRGYGSKQEKKPIVATLSTPLEDFCRVLGDEGALILRNARCVVVKCADRVAGAHVAVEDYGCDTLLLDDGFQYVRLERDEDIVVIDATNPFGNGHLIPRGILREPVKALRRATGIILTRCDQVQDFTPIIEKLKAISPHVPIRTTRHAPKYLTRIDDGSTVPLEFLRDKPVRAACAIAQPEAFFKTLEQLGARITDRLALPDHSKLPLESFENEAVTVITEKDAVKLASSGSNVLSLHVEIRNYP